MFVLELIQQLMQTAGETATSSNGYCPASECPAMAFTAIASALSTEGYFMQADILYYLRFGTYNALAPLLYVCSAIAGMVSLAMGAPPRNYMWFFLGPAIYAWLIDSTQPVKGVRWAVAGYEQDQSEVWRLAEVGLVNSSLVQRQQGDYNNEAQMGPVPPWMEPVQISNNAPPSGPIYVATPFLWVDEVTSGIAQWLAYWTGSYRSYSNGAGNVNSNIAQSGSTVGGEGKWFLLSNLKWQILDNITGAQLHNAELRDAFSTFMSTECGDRLSEGVDHARLVAYATTRGRNITFEETPTVFIKSPSDSGGGLRNTMGNLTRLLSQETIPTPRSLKNFMNQEASSGSKVSQENFKKFTSFIDTGKYRGTDNPDFEDKITCPQYLWLLIHGFRWEAAHIYSQILKSAPGDLNNNPEQLVHALFYGWGIRKASSNGEGDLLDTTELQHYLYNLILIHLIKNEMMITRQVVSPRHLTGTDTQRFAEESLKTVQQKSKYGELYSWAMMIPHIQGLLLYFLAMAYPFACVMVIVPGWHKTIFTWVSFYAWAKLWDVGFALITVFERSLWASIGNNSDTAAVSGLIAEMAAWGSVSNCGAVCDTQASSASGPAITEIHSGGSANGFSPVEGGEAAPGGLSGMQSFYFSLRTLDRAMLLAANLDLDLANGFYIYLLAGLYISVPAIVGQLVLGARSGVAGMIGQMYGSVASEAGGAAKSGYTSNWQQQAQQSQQALEQGAFAKAMRQQGLAHQALAAGNKALMHGMEGSKLESTNRGIGMLNEAQQRGIQSKGAWIGASAEAASIGADLLSGGGKSLGGTPGKALGFLGGTAARTIKAGGSVGSAINTNEGLGISNAHNARIAGNNPKVFGEGQRASGSKMEADRVGSQANFAAQEAVWAAKRDFGNHLAGASAARGVFAGTFGAGSKPMHLEGMAMSGMLNTYNGDGSVKNDTHEAASFGWSSAPGGFFSEVQSAQNGLNSSYGEGAIKSAYVPASFTEGFQGVEAGVNAIGQEPIRAAGARLNSSAETVSSVWGGGDTNESSPQG